MRVLLILVVFNFDTGSELTTRMDFDDVEDCHIEARLQFEGIDAGVDIRAMEIPDGQEMLEGTMIAYGSDGAEVGMYACNVLGSSSE